MTSLPERGARDAQLVSVVVPIYDSSATVIELAERLARTLPQAGFDYELLLVDDGSTDPRTWPAIESVVGGDPRARAFQLTRNFGQQAATICGLREARGDFVVTMDDDLQHRPEDVPLLLQQRHHDIVIAQFPRKNHTLWKRITSRIKGEFDHLVIGKPRSIQLSPFRLLSRTVVDGMLAVTTPHPFIPALMFYVSHDVVGVEATHDPRRLGQSGYGLLKMVRLFSDLLINNSSLLLRWVGQLGIICALVSFGLAALIAFQKLTYGIPVAGWASILATMLLLGGLLLFGLGVVGEYLIRIIEASESKPTYFVRRTCAADDHASRRSPHAY